MGTRRQTGRMAPTSFVAFESRCFSRTGGCLAPKETFEQQNTKHFEAVDFVHTPPATSLSLRTFLSAGRLDPPISRDPELNSG